MEESKKIFLRTLYYFLIKIVIICILSFFVLRFMIGILCIQGVDMVPHIKDGDVVIYNKLDNDYHIGDVVVYKVKSDFKCGRIVAREGDVIDLFDGELKINDHIQNENNIYPTFKIGDSLKYPYKVGNDGYFVLSDLRLQGNDSRQYGCIFNKDIQGKVIQLFRIRGF